MDYRHVQPPFRRLALVVHLVLLGLLLAYAGYEICEIASASRAPRIETIMEEWHGAGKWALCSGNTLDRAGVALPTARQFMHYEEIADSTDNRGSMLSRETIEINGRNQSCSVVDLSEWQMPLPPPVPFHLCGQGRKMSLYLHISGEWSYLGNSNDGSRLVLKLDKHKHGWNYGYATEEEDYFQVARAEESCCHDRHAECEHWSEFESTEGLGIFWRVVIETPLVTVSRKLGALPQLFSLLGNLGGYLALLTATFTTIFVRKYPHSDIANIYEARTLIGYQVPHNPCNPQEITPGPSSETCQTADVDVTTSPPPEGESVGAAVLLNATNPPPTSGTPQAGKTERSQEMLKL